MHSPTLQRPSVHRVSVAGQSKLRVLAILGKILLDAPSKAIRVDQRFPDFGIHKTFTLSENLLRLSDQGVRPAVNISKLTPRNGLSAVPASASRGRRSTASLTSCAPPDAAAAIFIARR